jgi:ankyrin repeat protein
MQVSQPINDIDVDCGDIHEAVSKGHVGCLQYFTSRHDAITANFKQQTPFHLIDHRTAPLCHELTTTLLKALSAEAATTLVNTADARSNTALHSTARYELDADGEIIDFDDDSLTVCHTCMRALLAVRANPTIKNKAGVQAVGIPEVLVAARRDNMKHDSTAADDCMTTIQALQQAGVDINMTSCNEYIDHHLHSAAGDDCLYYSDVAVRILLACGADVMLLNYKGWTAMHSAAYFEAGRHGDGGESEGNADVIQMLYDAADDVLLDATTADGQTALHLAVGWPKSVQKLCALGADVNANDNRFKKPLHTACQLGWCAKTVQILLRYDADTNAYSGQVEGCQECGGWQALHFAAVKGHNTDALDVLLDAGVDIDTHTVTGCSAAWLAARYLPTPHGCAQLKMLQQRGADLHFCMFAHGSLLHAAAGSGAVDTMQLLLDEGIDLFHDQFTAMWHTPLHCAAQGGHAAMVQLLLDKGCNDVSKDLKRNTALRLCLQGPRDNAACFQLLYDSGCDIKDVRDWYR